jgi:hypothetical protein
MSTKRKSLSNSKTLKDSINNSSEDEQIKQIVKEINRDNKNTFFFQYKSPAKIRSFIRNRSTLASSTIRRNNRNPSVKEKCENSLSFKLKDKITKETLILELRQELKYHIKFNAIYNNLLRKIIYLKEMVKENKDKVEQNTELLKETFRDRFNVIDQYEKTMILLNEEKKDILKTNKEIIKMRQQSSVKLKKEFNDIQIRNSKQREKIELLQNNINDLEYRKSHLNEELQKQLEKEEKKYEEHLKMYKALVKKYEYFLDEYNTFLKCGDEITKVDVKLFDDTNAKNYLIEENLEVELNEKLIKKSFLLSNINNLKLQIKFIEEKQQEEKLKEEKKLQSCKIVGFNKRRTTKNKNTKNKTNSNVFKKSLSYTNIFSKNN